MGATRRNGKIELMRFIMCIIVIIYHAELHINSDFVPRFLGFFTMSKHGCIVVEFFFLLNGFFMAKSAEKDSLLKMNHTVNDTVNFVSKRYASVFPFQLIAFFVIFVVNNLLYKAGFLKILVNLRNALPDLFLFSMSGVPYYKVNGVAWYLSSMIIGFIIIYPLLRGFYDKFSKYWAPVISVLLLLLLFIINDPTRISAVYKAYGFIRVANIRAICEMLMGVFCYVLSKKIAAREWKKGTLKILSAAEVLLAVSLIVFIFSPLSPPWQFLFLFVAAAYITICLSGVTYGNELFNKKWIYYLGKLSLSVYIIQYAGRNIAIKYLENVPYWGFILFCIVTAVIPGMIIMPLADRLSKSMLKLFKKAHLIY